MQSFKKNKKGILLMIISSLCVCIGQLFWKLSSNGNLIYLITGFLFCGSGALIMLIAYQYGSLSVLQPMLSFNYIFTIIIAYFILNETMTISKMIGIFIIVLGVIFIAGGDEK